jgi:hypothetical protein
MNQLYEQKYLKYKQKYLTLKNQLAGAEVPFTETTIRRICFDLPMQITKAQAAAVGPAKFKRYEHILYVSAQLSRLVYCDTGIMWHVIEKSLGLSNDIVNKVITAYDKQFKSQKTTPITSQKGESNLPMESYSLVVAKPNDPKYGTYISTHGDMTCLILNANKIKANPNSIIQPTDVFVSFKGSSTIKNFQHDLQSQFTAADLGQLVSSIGVKIQGTNNKVTGTFVKDLVKGWNVIMTSLGEHIKGGNTRLFLSGHSLGGAYCTLFGLILAEGKVTNTIPIMKNVKSIHIISFGSPTLLTDTARNLFNKHLDSGLITLDRVISQRISARSLIAQGAQAVLGAVTMGIGILGPNDVVPAIPFGFSHPGYKPSAIEFRPEANGRPYSIDNIRKTFGASNLGERYRDPATWPFLEDIKLGDRKYKKELAATVEKILNIKVSADESESADAVPTELKGGSEKSIYSELNKTHMSNFISHRGSVYAYGFAHAEYLGMFFFGGFRLYGMKNPAPKGRVAHFSLCNSGVKIEYLDQKADPVWPAEAALTKEEIANSDSSEKPNAKV